MKKLSNAGEQNLLDWLAAERPRMIALLADLVNTDSGSRDKLGVDAVGTRIRQFLESHDIHSDMIGDDTYGDAVRARVGSGSAKTILLMGHRDTVFPKGEASRRPFRVDHGKAYGPGVADMKAGLVMNAFVLAAYAKLGGAPAPLVGLFTGDEEIGSPFSRKVIEEEARKARAVFNAEPGRPSGAVVTGRKGGVFMRFTVTGKAAHSGANFEQGISAIEEIAHKIIALHKLVDLSKGVTLNVGLVSGGQTINTVAPSAVGEVDLRFREPADRDAKMKEVEKIIATSTVPGTSAKLEILGEFFPFVQSPASLRLFQHYVDCAEDAGLRITGEYTGGCADSGFASVAGAPTICGVGPIGAKAHSPDEYLEVDSIVPRAQSLALAIARLDRA